MKEEKFVRRSIKQHKDLLTDPKYRHKVEANRKVRLHSFAEEDFETELRDYINGTYEQNSQ